MAYQGKKMYNAKSGIETIFLNTARDSGGQLLEMETTYPARSPRPPLHYHPYQEEDFIILSGEMTVIIDGQKRILVPGDRLHIARNQVHAMWNHTNQKTVVNWKVRPALETEYFMEIATGLANDGKMTVKGKPVLLQSAVLMNRFSRVFRLEKPSYPLQRIMFGVLGAVARVMGYRGWHGAYVD